VLAGVHRIDITPDAPVWLDGMIRDRRSEGVHDRIHARALALSGDGSPGGAFVVVSVEVCALDGAFTDRVREAVEAETGIPRGSVVIAATHTHSAPAAYGFFNPREDSFASTLERNIAASARNALRALRPVSAGCGSGTETSVSRYRRLRARDGRVVMNWEDVDPGDIEGALGEADSEVGVIALLSAVEPKKPVAVLFNHAGHPNVMSGDNLLVSGDYAGHAMTVLERELGCAALFLNGAQGSVDIDGRRDRDWNGVERAGAALADVVADTVRSIRFSGRCPLSVDSVRYTVPARTVTDDEMAWAERIIEETGGSVGVRADGVGDDYLANLLIELRGAQDRPVEIEQVGAAFGDCALVAFPGELFTEIGREIKAASPFARIWIVGLANGYIGYVPTSRAVAEGGYAVKTDSSDRKRSIPTTITRG